MPAPRFDVELRYKSKGRRLLRATQGFEKKARHSEVFCSRAFKNSGINGLFGVAAWHISPNFHWCLMTSQASVIDDQTSQAPALSSASREPGAQQARPTWLQRSATPLVRPHAEFCRSGSVGCCDEGSGLIRWSSAKRSDCRGSRVTRGCWIFVHCGRHMQIRNAAPRKRERYGETYIKIFFGWSGYFLYHFGKAPAAVVLWFPNNFGQFELGAASSLASSALCTHYRASHFQMEGVNFNPIYRPRRNILCLCMTRYTCT